MGRDNSDEIKVVVPVDMGYIIGDFLRKFALRGLPTWQIAGYKVDSTTPNFSFSSGSMSSYLSLLKGRLVLESEQEPGDPVVKKFSWDGSSYRNGSMTIEGLDHGMGDSLVVALNYTNNIKDAKQNYEICKIAAGGDATGFFAVPSRHVATKSFRFDVTPIDDKTEYLTIRADYRILNAAYDTAVKSLQGLNL